MSKHRPEIISLRAPFIYADKIMEILNKELGKNAKLKNKAIDGGVLFLFSPTKSEHFIVGLKVAILCSDLTTASQ